MGDSVNRWDAEHRGDISDGTLLAGVRRRDDRALRALIDRHGGAVLGVARRVLLDHSLAEEVAQDTFLALWRRPEAYDRSRGALRGWLCSIARNKAVDLVRKEQRVLDRAARASDLFTAIDDDPLRDDTVEERHSVRRAVAALTDMQREALFLAYFCGFTYREVALELGVPEGTAKTRLRDALRGLQRRLGDLRAA